MVMDKFDLTELEARILEFLDEDPEGVAEEKDVETQALDKKTGRSLVLDALLGLKQKGLISRERERDTDLIQITPRGKSLIRR